MLLIGVFTKVGWANADPAPNRYRAALIDPRVRLWSAALDLPRLPWVSWTPYHSLDLLALGLLPDGWDSAMRTLLDAPERIRILPGPGGYDLSWCFDIVEGHVLDAHLPWLSALYHGVCCDFAARAAGYPLYPANRQSAGMTLNILSGAGAVSDWHQDMTAVTGVLFVTPAQAYGAGDLLFRATSYRTPGAGWRLAGATWCFASARGARGGSRRGRGCSSAFPARSSITSPR